MLPDETEFTDSLMRARREHRHALQRCDVDAARLLQVAIAALEATKAASPSAVEQPAQVPVHLAAARRIHASRPDIPLATIIRATSHAAISLAVANGEQPSAEQVRALALDRLDR